MKTPVVPQRIPPLEWRRPVWLWTPLALVSAIAWPAALFEAGSALQRAALIAGAAVFALALISLGASWALGRAPKTRLIVMLHVVLAAAAVSFVAPLFWAAEGRVAPLAVAPLAITIGLPAALISGVVFSAIALRRPRQDDRMLVEDPAFRHDVQPFR